MTYDEYIAYHKRGDASIEERLVPVIAKRLGLNGWNAFRFYYLYATLYHIPSVIDLMRNPNTPKSSLVFRTDRRYVRIGDTYERMIAQLKPELMERLQACRTTSEAYKEVTSWYFFGRYAAYLFLEVYYYAYPHSVERDDFMCAWERGENYTNGAALLAGTNDKKRLDEFLTQAKADTGDNAFALETSLCAVWKMHKKGLTEGYCAERLVKLVCESKYQNFLLPLISTS